LDFISHHDPLHIDFLPSLDELRAMYENLAQNGTGNISGGLYWSSSEVLGMNYAYAINFADGGESYPHKSLSLSIRAVRQFTE
jgi:hypothetical protein